VGYGYMQEYEIGRLYRDARIIRIFQGTNEINRITIAKTFLKQYEQDNDIIDEVTKQIQHESSYSFIRFSMRLLQIISKALPHTKKQMVVKDQECLRLLADVIKELYVIKAALLRQRRATDNQRNEQLITEVLCEEGYRKIEAAKISIISSTITDNVEKQALLDEIKNLPIPLYTNLFSKKREIAIRVIESDGYCI